MSTCAQEIVLKTLATVSRWDTGIMFPTGKLTQLPAAGFLHDLMHPGHPHCVEQVASVANNLFGVRWSTLHGLRLLLCMRQLTMAPDYMLHFTSDMSQPGYLQRAEALR